MADLPSASRGEVSFPWRLTLSTLDRLPQGALSRLAGAAADIRLPRWSRRFVLGSFAKLTGIDVSEAARPLEEYASVNEFFVRRLRPDVHSWPSDERLLCSPVDGVVGEVGRISDGRLIQAKGMPYRAGELLGADEGQAAAYEGGLFITIYLSPRHYHRIHTPMAGHVLLARHVPGRLFPVNEPAIRSIDKVFARNERLVCTLSGASGPLAVVAVGAYNVGRISTAFDPDWSGRVGGWITNRGTPPPPERRYRYPVYVPTGSELMAFHLGSTVVMLTTPGLELADGIEPGRDVRVGHVLAAPATTD